MSAPGWFRRFSGGGGSTPRGRGGAATADPFRPRLSVPADAPLRAVHPPPPPLGAAVAGSPTGEAPRAGGDRTATSLVVPAGQLLPWGSLEPANALAAHLLFATRSFPLGPRRSVAVGRSATGAASLGLELQSVSCAHLSIVCAAASVFYVIDDSTNGTWVNGERCARGAPVPLRSGDSLCLCAPSPASDKCVAFLFVANPDATPAGAHPASATGGGAAGAAALEAGAAAAAAAAAAFKPEDAAPPDTRCSVCLEGHVRVLSLPCAHLVLCAACDARLASQQQPGGTRACPLCRQPCTATVLVRWP